MEKKESKLRDMNEQEYKEYLKDVAKHLEKEGLLEKVKETVAVNTQR